MTRLQVLEKQNKDLRARLENRQGKAELALCAMEDEVKTLRIQLREKDKVIVMLQSEVCSLTKELEDANDLRAETIKGQIDVAITNATAPLLDELSKAHLEIGRLKAIINKDSSNSSKPSSVNGFRKVINLKEKSTLKRGGQLGHPGHRLALPENLEELEEKGIIRRQIVDHTDGSSEYISRYVIDVEVVTTITEYRFAPNAELPENLYNEVSYGDNIRGMSVLLVSEGIIAEDRLSEIIAGLTKGVVSISPATLERFKLQFAKKLESSGELESIKEDLLNGEVMCVDDTPMRSSQTVDYLETGEQIKRDVEKGSFRVTVRTHSNENSTLYTVNPKKDILGIKRDDILPRYFGILGHDHEIKFYNYGTWHATCGEHLLRDLTGLLDLENIAWAEGMRSLISEMNNHKNKDVEMGKTACDPIVLAGFEKKYNDLIEQGRIELEKMLENELGYKGFRAMLIRLTEYKDCYFLFIRNYKAPFSSNLAERDLRMEKTKEKVSGLFRSWDGIVNHTKIRSYISTVKKRNIDIFSAITHIFMGNSVLQKEKSSSQNRETEEGIFTKVS